MRKQDEDLKKEVAKIKAEQKMHEK